MPYWCHCMWMWNASVSFDQEAWEVMLDSFGVHSLIRRAPYLSVSLAGTHHDTAHRRHLGNAQGIFPGGGWDLMTIWNDAQSQLWRVFLLPTNTKFSLNQPYSMLTPWWADECGLPGLGPKMDVYELLE